MVSLSATELLLNVVEMRSYVRGYCAYRDIWTPYTGEVLPLRREPDNLTNPSAVAVISDGEVVGHIPYNVASTVSLFLRRAVNKAFVEVTGERVNRGAGDGVEIPCIYRSYCPEPCMNGIKEVFSSLSTKGLL